MKTDTIVFASMTIGKYFNFAPENSRGDPFLIQTSVSGNIIAGNRARAIRKGKEGQSIKRTIPLGDDDMGKARACEEMILYERPVSSTSKPTSASPGITGRNDEKDEDLVKSQISSLKEFESALVQYINDTTLSGLQK